MHPHEKKRPILYSETKIKMHIDILSYIKQSQNIKEHDFGSVERKKKFWEDKILYTVKMAFKNEDEMVTFSDK